MGALARQTGLTVRTLHHYDEIGLLSPSRRTSAGHRLYTADDLGRLLQILTLRQSGLSLEAIRESLARPESTLLRILGRHVEHLRERIEAQQKLCRRLERVAERLRAAETVSVDEFITSLEAITMYETLHEKYFTSEQRREIEKRGERIGQKQIRHAEAEWPQLIAKVRAAMDQGTAPESEEVQPLARRWQELVREFTGGNPGIQQSLNEMYTKEPELQRGTGIDPQLSDYVRRAMAAIREKS